MGLPLPLVIGSMATRADHPMPSINADFETIWAYLEEGIDDIMTHPRDGVSYSLYVKLMTTAFNYSTTCRKHGNLKDGVGARRNGPLEMSSDLYHKLLRYFVGHVSSFRDISDSLTEENLLRYYVRKWERYIEGVSYVTRVFMYLNRHLVKREKEDGRKNVYPVHVLALVQWKLHFFLYLQNKDSKLTSAILNLIESQRNGETIDQDLVKKVIKSFVTLGINEGNLNAVSLDVYKEHFESPFIMATEKYYKTESDTFLAQKSLSGYLKRAEERLREEEDRVERSLNAKTRRILIRTCEHALIREHSEEMWDEFQRLLDYDKDEDLQRMYALLDRIPEGLQPLRRQFEEYVKRAGHRAVSKLVTMGGDNADSLELTAYVDSLFEVCRQHEDIVQRNFASERGFIAALEKGCRGFVDYNAATGTDLTKSPELLALSADAMLHKSSKLSEEGGLEDALSRLIAVLKYLSEKDVFQIFYRSKLAKRLIYHHSLSDTAEASMIFKLKEVCPFQFTNKIQRMFNDMDLSRELTETFKTHTTGDVTLDITVLGTNSWPIHAPEHQFVIPREILPTYEHFTSYYHSNHSGRKLTWLWNYSTNRLRAYYLNQKYILVTTSYQMAILLQYNRNVSLSLEELIDSTGIPKELLAQILELLVRMKLLVNEEPDQYDLNFKLTSKKICVNLNMPMKAEVKAEGERVLRTVDEERNYAIQAIIVRIMKIRKSLSHQALITEIIEQISMRFTPKICDIKRALESLLEKDYLERDEGKRDTYNYLA